MKKNFDVSMISAVPIYHSRFNIDEVSAELKIIEDLDLVSAEKNQVSENTDILNNTNLKNLKQVSEHHLKNFISNVIYCKQEFYIINSWIAVSKPGQEHTVHYHPNSIFSGVLYLQSSQKSGTINFYWKSPMKKEYGFNYDYYQNNLFNAESWSFQPESGDIVIFPSWLRHSVTRNESSDPRIVLGFNTFVKGEFGSNEYSAKLKL